MTNKKIVVSKSNHRAMTKLKHELNLSSFNSLITKLLDNYYQNFATDVMQPSYNIFARNKDYY